MLEVDDDSVMPDYMKDVFNDEVEEINNEIRRQYVETRAVNNERESLEDKSFSYLSLMTISFVIVTVINYIRFENEIITSLILSSILFSLAGYMSDLLGNLIILDKVEEVYRKAYKVLHDTVIAGEEFLFPFNDKEKLGSDKVKEMGKEVFCKLQRNKDKENNFLENIILWVSVIAIISYLITFVAVLSGKIFLLGLFSIILIIFFSLTFYKYTHFNNILLSIKNICFRRLEVKKKLILSLQKTVRVFDKDKKSAKTELKWINFKIKMLYLGLLINTLVLGYNGAKGLADWFNQGYIYILGFPVNPFTYALSGTFIICTDIFFSIFIKEGLNLDYYNNLLARGYLFDDYKNLEGIFIQDLSKNRVKWLIISLIFFAVDVVINSSYRTAVLGLNMDALSFFVCLLPCSASLLLGYLKGVIKHKQSKLKAFTKLNNF